MNLREAAENAIRALRRATYIGRPEITADCESAIGELHAALAEPAEYAVECNGKKSAVLTAMMNGRTKREAALAEADEPDGPDGLGLYHNRIHKEIPNSRPAYAVRAGSAHPPRREPLTDEEIDAITRDRWGTQLLGVMVQTHREYARAIERAHGIGDSDE